MCVVKTRKMKQSVRDNCTMREVGNRCVIGAFGYVVYGQQGEPFSMIHSMSHSDRFVWRWRSHEVNPSSFSRPLCHQDTLQIVLFDWFMPSSINLVSIMIVWQMGLWIVEWLQTRENSLVLEKKKWFTLELFYLIEMIQTHIGSSLWTLWKYWLYNKFKLLLIWMAHQIHRSHLWWPVYIYVHHFTD